MRILIVSRSLPYLPCRHGPRARLARVLEALAARHDVALVAPVSPAETPAQRAWAQGRVAWASLVATTAASAADDPLAALAEAAARAAGEVAPDVLLLDGDAVAPLARLRGIPTALALDASPALRAPETRRRPVPWRWVAERLPERRAATEQRRALAAADVRIVGSAEEQAALARLGVSGRTEIVPAGVDPARHEFRRAGQPGRIALAVDLASRADAETAWRFVGGALSRIRARCPGAELLLVGASRDDAARVLGGVRGVRATGAVADARPALWSATVVVAPFRPGFGAPSRIVEAMALGTPVVASRRSLAGLDGVQAGRHVLVADGDEETADAVVTLLRDAALADALAREARAVAERRLAWDAVAPRWEALLARVAAPAAAEATA